MTFVDADDATGPILNLGFQPNVYFRFIVRNTGEETLEDVVVNDNVYGNVTLSLTTLAPGESTQTDIIVAGTLGNHENIATVTGTGVDSGPVFTNSDAAHYVGAEQTISINLVKYVSPDNGVTWFDANTPPRPFVLFPQDPKFRFVVTNTGEETLIDITITDMGSRTILFVLIYIPVFDSCRK